MTGIEIGILAVVVLLVLIYLGMPIGVAMLVVSFAGVAIIRNQGVAIRMAGAVANDSLRQYLFAVVPLFVLMGLLVTVSGVGKDTFDVFQRLLRRVTAGLGVATVFANAVFAFDHRGIFPSLGHGFLPASAVPRIDAPRVIPKLSNRVRRRSSVWDADPAVAAE